MHKKTLKTGLDFRKILLVSFELVFVASMIGSSFTAAYAAKTLQTESSTSPDIRRSVPIDSHHNLSSLTPAPIVSPSATISGPSVTNFSGILVDITPSLTSGQTLGPNLVPNPSVETADTSGLPAHWHKGGYGTN